MAELQYKVPSNTILENRKLFYSLKRESNERTQTWLRRIQWHINRCAFPKIIEFLLIDKFMCELHFDELEFIRRMETWSLSQLYEYFLNEKIADGQAIDSCHGKSTSFHEIDSLSLNSTTDMTSRNMWTASEEADFNGINDMLIDSMKCETEINGFPGCNPVDKTTSVEAEQKRKNNLRRHTSKRAKTHTCHQCSKTFTRMDNLNAHIRTIHEGIRSHACNECGKYFVSNMDLKRHLNTHIGLKPFRCDLCEKSFTQSFDLKRHKLSVHQAIRPFSCDKCEKSFTRSSHLNDHKKTIHEGIKPIKPFNCDQCEISFKRMSHLKQHKQTIHDGIRPYSCNQCEKTFTQSGHLTKHLVKHQVTLV